MPTTLFITRDVEERFRGYLATVSLELSAGVYLSPRMSMTVRVRTWTVLTEWHAALGSGSITMAWPDPSRSGGVGLMTLGDPPRDIVDMDGVLCVLRHK